MKIKNENYSFFIFLYYINIIMKRTVSFNNITTINEFEVKSYEDDKLTNMEKYFNNILTNLEKKYIDEYKNKTINLYNIKLTNIDKYQNIIIELSMYDWNNKIKNIELDNTKFNWNINNIKKCYFNIFTQPVFSLTNNDQDSSDDENEKKLITQFSIDMQYLIEEYNSNNKYIQLRDLFSGLILNFNLNID